MVKVKSTALKLKGLSDSLFIFECLWHYGANYKRSLLYRPYAKSQFPNRNSPS